jgi:hypothetical protein
MATFAYEALSTSGKPQKGTVEATSTEEAIAKIKSQGLYPSSIKEQAAAKKDGGAPAGRRHVAGQAAHGGGFAGAVRAQEARDDAIGDGERQVIDRAKAAERLAEMLDADSHVEDTTRAPSLVTPPIPSPDAWISTH